MNTEKLMSTIELYRPLPALSSLPVAVLDNGEFKARWFNFYLGQNDNELTISITSIFTMGSNMEVAELKTNIQLISTISDFNEPELSNEEYLELLKSQFAHYDSSAMEKLLQQAEIQPLWAAYATLIK